MLSEELSENYLKWPTVSAIINAGVTKKRKTSEAMLVAEMEHSDKSSPNFTVLTLKGIAILKFLWISLDVGD